MPYSSLTKTRWSSDSEHSGRPARQTAGPALLIELDDVSLRFVSYADKQYSLKRAVLDLVLRRESPAPSTEFWALRDISLKIAHGDRVGIVGGNGAGKSTLLRLMAMIYPPTSGRLSIRGSVAPLIEMGAGFNPELSGTDNILLNGAMLGFSRKQMLAKLEPIHEFTGLREFADMPSSTYSSGMYMRLAFAIATEVNPDISLGRRVAGSGRCGVPRKGRRLASGELLDRSKEVVLVSHDRDTLRDLCTRGLWIDHGRLVADGPIDEAIDRYLEFATSAATAAVSA